MSNAPRDENFVPASLFEVQGAPGTVMAGRIDQSTGRVLVDDPGTTGDVTGPASSTDNAIARFDGTTGKVIQNSNAIIDDTGNATFAGQVDIPGNTISSSLALRFGLTGSGIGTGFSHQTSGENIIMFANGVNVATVGVSIANLNVMTNLNGVGTASAPRLVFNSDTNTGFFGTSTADTVYFSSGGVQKAVLNPTGFGVGTGLLLPLRTFHVVGGSGSQDSAAVQSPSTGAYASFGFFNAGGTQQASFGYSDGAGGTLNNSFFVNANSLPFHIAQSGQPKVTVISNGSMGIGNVSPATALSVASSGANGINLEADGGDSTQSGRLFFSNGTAGQGYTIQNISSSLAFRASSTAGTSSGTTRMVITSAGSVGIGNNSPSYTLHVTGNFGVSGANTYGTYAQITASTMELLSASGLSLRADVGSLIFKSGGNTERARIDSSGNFGIGTTTPNANAILDVSSTTKAVLFPRMTTVEKNAISSPTGGMVVYDTTLGKLCVYGASSWETITSV